MSKEPQKPLTAEQTKQTLSSIHQLAKEVDYDYGLPIDINWFVEKATEKINDLFSQQVSIALAEKEEEIKALREALIKLNEVVIKYHPHCYMPENEDLYTAIHESKEIIKRTKQP